MEDHYIKELFEPLINRVDEEQGCIRLFDRSARDFDADEAEEIGDHVDNLARRIAQFPAESINACKQAVYESIDKPIDEALKAEAYWLYQATSKTTAIKRFTIADEQGLEHDIENQRNWNDLVMKVQEIN